MFGLKRLFRRSFGASSSCEEKSKVDEGKEAQIIEEVAMPTGRAQERLLSDAQEYLHLFHEECGLLDKELARLSEIRLEIASTGTYRQTAAELTYGARVAWRNNTRCIGRLHWQTLIVRDLRHY